MQTHCPVPETRSQELRKNASEDWASSISITSRAKNQDPNLQRAVELKRLGKGFLPEKIDNFSTSICSSLQKHLGSGAALSCCLFPREYVSLNRNHHYSLETRRVARDHCLHLRSHQTTADMTFQ